MEKDRYSGWIDNSRGLMYIEMPLVGDAQRLGILEVELIKNIKSPLDNL